MRHNNIYGDATLGICTSLLVQGLLGEQRNLLLVRAGKFADQDAGRHERQNHRLFSRWIVEPRRAAGAAGAGESQRQADGARRSEAFCAALSIERLVKASEAMMGNPALARSDAVTDQSARPSGIPKG